MSKPLITICVPVYNSEPTLMACLLSVQNQTFVLQNCIQLIVVNDASCGLDADGNDCKKIVRLFEKGLKKARLSKNLLVSYVEHTKNKGLVETRRSGVYAAKAPYIFILDSDDFLELNALEILYTKAQETGADIVHAGARAFFLDKKTEAGNGEYLSSLNEKINKIHIGILEGRQIFKGYLVQNSYCSFLWGKLFKTEVYLEALTRIPSVYCTMAEDILQFFFIASQSHLYAGIPDVIYNYCLDTGISSHKDIESIEQWAKVCSTSSVFTVIFEFLNSYKAETGLDFLEQDEMDAMRLLCCKYVANNLEQLKLVVAEKIKPAAYNLLCDFWGQKLVEDVSRRMKE